MKILVIRFLAMGDVIISSVLCNSLKKSFPESQVDYLTHETSASLFKNHPYIDNVIALAMSERKNPIKYFKKIRQIAGDKYDIVIDASSTGKSELISLFSRQTKYRIGRYKRKRGLSYTHKVKPGFHHGDKVKQRLDMLQPLTQNGFHLTFDSEMVIHITTQEKQTMQDTMLKHGVDFERPVFVFAVSSKESHKKWRRESMVEVIKHCLNNLNGQVVLYYWGESEHADVTTIHSKALNGNANVFSDISTPTPRDLATLMANCDMFIGNEGGPRHISQALQLPSVAIFSPSAGKHEWLPNADDRYVGIEWNELLEYSDYVQITYENGDADYNRLYDSITPAHVIPLVNQVFDRYVRGKFEE